MNLLKSFERQGHGPVRRAAAAGGRGQEGGVVPPSPSTVLMLVQPDVVSLNTVMKAWSEFSPRQWTDRGGRARKCDEYSNKDAAGQVGTTTAERTGGIGVDAGIVGRRGVRTDHGALELHATYYWITFNVLEN